MPKPSVAQRPGLRALVPYTYSAEGETHPFVRAWKAKWLSRLDFKSDVNIESLFLLSMMLVALDRHAEAEGIADSLVAHVDTQAMSRQRRLVVASALSLSAWLKAKRDDPAALVLVERARVVGQSMAHQDRAWLATDVRIEIGDALERKRLDYLVHPFTGILRWVNVGAARLKAEETLGVALEATRALMTG